MPLSATPLASRSTSPTFGAAAKANLLFVLNRVAPTVPVLKNAVTLVKTRPGSLNAGSTKTK